MVIDFQQLYNQLLNTYNSFKDITTKLKDIFINPTPQDVPVKIIDENGNPTTVNIPNLSKWKQYVWNDALSAMYRTYYVDQVNGDDNNLGTADKPFKTIKKAVDSIPVSGYGIIYIIGDYYHNNESISVIGKNINITLKGTLTIDSFTKQIGNETYYIYNFLSVYNSSIFIYLDSLYNSKLIINDVPDNVKQTPYNGAFVVRENSQYGNIYIYLRIREDNYTPMIIGRNAILFSIYEWSVNRPNDFTINISGHYNGTNRSIILKQNSKIAELKYSPSHIYINYAGGFVDENGNSIDLKNYINGIIRDSNKVPRNVISNIIF